MNKVANWIGASYKWFWQDFLMRTEPFTSQFKRMARKFPVVWVLFPALVIVVYFAFVIWGVKRLRWLWFILGIWLTICITWLLLHLGEFI